MTELTENLNFISSLPNAPSLSTQGLKQEFDKAGNKIKDYINGTLLPEVAEADSGVSSAVEEQLDDFRTEIEGELSELSETLEGDISSIESTVNSLSTTVGAKSVYGDFVVTGASRYDSLPKSSPTYKDYTFTLTMNNNGYFPIGIVGFNYIKAAVNAELLRCEMTSRTSGRVVITYTLRLNNTIDTTNHTLYCQVLWVKIR